MSESVVSIETVSSSGRTIKQFIEGYSNHLKLGFVGKANAGKSSLFNCYGREFGIQAETDECLFCTIDPSMAMHTVEDDRFEWLYKVYNAERSRRLLATVADTVGLIKGSHEGRGVSTTTSKDMLRQVDVLVHLIRTYEDDDIPFFENKLDPVRDIHIVHQELLLMDLETIEKALMNLEGITTKDKIGGETLAFEHRVLCKLWKHVAGSDRPKPTEAELKKARTIFRKVNIPSVCIGIPVRYGKYTTREINFIVTLQLISSKEMVYALNCSARDYLRPAAPSLEEIKKEIAFMDKFAIVFPISIAFEQSLERIESENFVDPYNIYPESRVGSPVKTTRNYIEETAANDGHGQLKVDLDDALEAYKAANPTHKSCIPFVVQESLRALNLLRFYVCREDKDVLVYLLRQGSTIVEAAARVDVHISRNFIRADVMMYEELFECKGDWVKLKISGGVKSQAKKYIVNDGDIIEFFYHDEK